MPVKLKRKPKARRVTLPHALDAYVDDCVASGKYVDANEVLAEAVRMLSYKNYLLVPMRHGLPKTINARKYLRRVKGHLIYTGPVPKGYDAAKAVREERDSRA